MKHRSGTGGRDYLVSFVLVLCAGAALRLHGIAEFPLVEDSFYTLRDSLNLTEHIRVRPVYYLLQNGLFQIIPVSPVSLRILSLVFGVLGIWAIWAASNQLFGRFAAVSTAALVAFSPWHIHISQVGRYWSLVFLEATLLFWAFGIAYRQKHIRPLAIGSGVAIFSVLTHPTFVFLLPGFVIASMVSATNNGYRLQLPQSKWMYLLLFGFISVCVIVSLAVGLPALDGSQFSPAKLLTTTRLMPAVIQWVGPVIAIAVTLSIVVLLRSSPNIGLRWWGSSAIIISVVFLVALFVGSVYRDVYAYYVTALLPLWFLLIGAALYRLENELSRIVAAGIVILLIASVTPSIVSNLRDGTRFDYRPAYDYIQEHGHEDPVFGTPRAAAKYYAPDLDFHELTMRPDQLQQSYDSHESIWVIASYRRYGFLNDPSGSIERWLWDHCKIAHKYEKVRFDFRRYAAHLHVCSKEPS